jgi:diguanylate cyclase (GGDEF)-like protein
MAFSIRNLKIRQQILMLTLPVVVVLLFAIGLFLNTFWMARRMDLASRHSVEMVGRGESLLRHLEEAHVGLRGYLITAQPEFLTAYNSTDREVIQDIGVLRDLAANDYTRQSEVESIRDNIRSWQNEWARPAILQTQRSGAAGTAETLSEGEKRIDSIRTQILKLLDENNVESMARARDAERLMRLMVQFGIGLGVLVAGILLFTTRAVSRLIARPVQELIEVTERVGRGDLQTITPSADDNEFGVLSRSFSRMTTALRHEREDLSALNRFSEGVTQCTTEAEVYDQLLHSLRERFNPRQVIVFKLNSNENFLEAATSLTPLPDNLRAWPVIDEPHNCRAVRTGRRFRVNDVAEEPLCPAKFAPPTEGSYYCGPLIAGGILIGAVRLEGLKDFWTQERESLLESYLSGTASALSNLRLLANMKQRANVDELTGFYNRRFLEDYARKALAMASRKTTPLCLMMMDLDHFKSFNDTYGHEVGDRILRQFAKTVTQAMRETNLAARYGGEEFVLLLPDTDIQAALLVAERIRQAVEKMVVPSGMDKPLPRVTVSLGIATYPEHGKSLEDLLKASDKALYESKHAGRNRATVYVEQTETAT